MYQPHQPAHMRLFVCVECDELTAKITAIQELFEDASGLRFTDPTQAHLTLKFLGETDAEVVPTLREELAAAIDDADVSPFELTAGGVGVFPELEYIQVLWLGIEEGTAELTRLHRAIENRTTTLGFEPEQHDFTPHITLARMDHAGGKSIVQKEVRSRDPTAGTIRVDAVTLMQSTLTPDGPEYESIERFSL